MSAASGVPVLALRNVVRTFGRAGNETHALRSANLTVQRGEFVAVVGPSGSGKSTLLNILGLLDTASGGTYMLAGVEVGRLRERERDAFRSRTIGFVFQASHVLLDETAAGNAALGLKLRGEPVAVRRAQVASALARLGMLPRARERAANLSGGERQRIAIARAIATRPTLLLADEPTGALDTTNSRLIIEHLQQLNRAGVTVVVITHDAEVAAAASRQVRLIDGVVDDGTASTVSEVQEAIQPQLARGRLATGEKGRRLADADAEAGTGVRDEGTVGEGAPWRQRSAMAARRIWDEILDAVSTHSSRPARTILLLLAFLLGTGGLVCSIGVSQSAAAQVSERLTAASLDEVTVRSADPSASAADFYDAVSDTAPAARIRALDGVRSVSFTASIPTTEAAVTLLRPNSFPDQPVFRGVVRVADANYLDLTQARVEPASAAGLLGNVWGGRVAMLGVDAARELGIGAFGPGSQVWVNGEAVDVVGIIVEHGRDPVLANSVLLSVAAAETLPQEDRRLVVRTEPGLPAAVAEAIPIAVDAGAPQSVAVETVADLRQLRRGVASDLGALIGLVSLILLALATLSAATTMYLSVQSRAAEVALRRAIGASRASIWRLFTFEGAIIGVAGGLAGAAVGLLGVVAIASVQLWTPVLDVRIVPAGVLIGCLTGVVSATYPAIVAARADPAQAIRG